MRRSVLAALVAVAAAVLVARYAHSPSGDLHAEWVLGRSVLDGASPFQPMAELSGRYGIDIGWSFVVPRLPSGILLLVPVALIPQSWLMLAGVVVVVGLGVALAVVVSRLAGLELWRAVVWLPVFLVGEVGWELATHGHLTAFFTSAAIGWAWLCLRRDRDVQAGVFLGLAVALKLFPWLIVATLLPSRRRMAHVAGGVFAGLNLVGLLLPGVSLEASVGSLQGGLVFLGHHRNGSLAAVTGLPPVVFLVLGLVAVGWMWRTYGDYERLFGLAIPISLLVAPIAWALYLPVLLIPLAARSRRLIMSGLLVAWVVWRTVAPSGNDISLIVFASIVIVLVSELSMSRTDPTSLSHPTQSDPNRGKR